MRGVERWVSSGCFKSAFVQAVHDKMMAEKVAVEKRIAEVSKTRLSAASSLSCHCLPLPSHAIPLLFPPLFPLPHAATRCRTLPHAAVPLRCHRLTLPTIIANDHRISSLLLSSP